NLKGRIYTAANGRKLSIQLSNADPDERLILTYAADDEGMHQLGFKAVSSSAVFKFDDLESLSKLLADLMGISETTVNLHYDPAAKQLLFRLKLPASFDK